MSSPALLPRIMHWLGFPNVGRIKDAPPFLGDIARTERWNGGNLSDIGDAQSRALSNAWVWMAINRICSELVQAEFQVVRAVMGQETETEIPLHSFLSLMRKPNPWLNRAFLWYYTGFWLELDGNGFWFLGLGPDGRVKEVWPMPANQVGVIPGSDRFVDGYEFTVGGRRYLIPPEYIVHFKLPNPFSLYRGLGQLAASMLAIDTDNAMARWNGSFFGTNNVMPSAIINISSGDPNVEIDPADVAAIKADLRASYSAHERKTVITSGQTLSVHTLGWNPQEMDFLQGRVFSREEILYAFGVPPGLFDKNVTRATADANLAVFRDGTVWPLMQVISEQLNTQLFDGHYYPKEQSCRIKDIRTGNRELELQEVEQAGPYLTVDEIRARYWNLGPYPKEARQEKERDRQFELQKLEIQARTPQVVPAETPPVPVPPVAGGLPIHPAFARVPPPPARALDLTRWKQKALKAVRAGKPADVRFDSDAIPENLARLIHQNLARANSADGVRAIFALIPNLQSASEVAEDSLKMTRLAADARDNGEEHEQSLEEIDAFIRDFNRMFPELSGLLEAATLPPQAG